MTVQEFLQNYEDIVIMYELYVRDHKERNYSNNQPISIWQYVDDFKQCESCRRWLPDVEETNAHGWLCGGCRNDL
jgi:hypothetical protein